MRNIKLTIEYDGTHFNGWQIQDKTKRTIQGEIQRACKKVFHQPITIFGSGRTDSGVHAVGQVANFKVSTTLTPFEIIRALNASLPADISIVNAQDVPENFHSQFTAKSKIYRYTILNRKGRGALQRDFCYFYPYKLNLRLMRQEAKILAGRKDFKSFQASDAKRLNEKIIRSSVRTLTRISVTKKGDFITIDFEANGFLYKMVRNIVGTLIEIGRGNLPKGSMEKILSKKNRIFAAQTAKAKGLCLLKVNY